MSTSVEPPRAGEPSLEMLRLALEQMPTAAALVEAPSGRVILSNERNRVILGQPIGALNDVAEYARIRGFHEGGGPVEPHEWPIARAIERGEIVRGELLRIERGDGSEVFVRVDAAPVRDAEGRIVAGIVTYDDVTDARRAELALREQSRINETLVRIGNVLNSELDLDALMQTLTDEATSLCRAQFGAFFYNVTNERGETYLLYTLSGVSKEAFAGFPMPRNTAIFGPTFSGRAVMRLDDVTKDPRYGKNAPHRGMPAGHLPVVSYLAVPVRSRSGEVLGGLFFGHHAVGAFTEADERLLVAVAAQAAVAIDNGQLFRAVRDAEARARADLAAIREAEREQAILFQTAEAERKRAEEASRLKDEFLATVSHELRTPLSAILGWTALLRGERRPDAASIAKGIQVIERNARSQLRIIEDILDVSRIIRGQLRLEAEPMDLEPIARDVLESVRPSTAAKGITLAYRDGGPCRLVADPERLRQILWNLLSNAVKFTPEGGEVELSTEQRGAKVHVSVRDTGRGIEPEFLPHVFERFRQADSTPSRAHGGLGLGLAIVRHLAEMHGGTVRAESGGIDRGATFTVTLPVRPFTTKVGSDSLRAGGDAPPDAREGALRDARILVVEDEDDARELIEIVLEGEGAIVRAAGSAEDALDLVGAFDPEILVSDIGMPERDGYWLIRAVRAVRPRLPALALTAFTRREDAERARAAGFDAHVGKPVDPARLVQTLAAFPRLSGAPAGGNMPPARGGTG